jgi:hypothetical protein
LGLHVYGNFNTIIQESDLSSLGPSGGGIRIDGVGNNLIVSENSLVKGIGPKGIGILVSFGKEHSLIIKGEVWGSSDALRLDLGHNLMDTKEEQNLDGYGNLSLASFYKHVEEGLSYEFTEAESLLSGPLVRTISIEGVLLSEKRAIYISPNAYLETIYVRSGAIIQGDIISDYDDRGNGTNLSTKLIFGDSSEDNNLSKISFDFRINSRILGSGKSLQEGEERLYGGRGLLDLIIKSGNISLEDLSRIEVNSFSLEKDATLIIKPNLSASRPIFLEANTLVFQEGAKLIVSASTTQGTKGEDVYFTPILRIKAKDAPLSSVNNVDLTLDPASGLTNGSLAWYSNGLTDYLLVYQRPSARFPK